MTARQADDTQPSRTLNYTSQGRPRSSGVMSLAQILGVAPAAREWEYSGPEGRAPLTARALA
jgi:hypothetical protein